MDSITHEQAVEAWTRIAKSHVNNVKRNQQEREQVALALQWSDARMGRKSGTMPLEVQRYHAIGHQILLESAALLDLMNLTEKEPPSLAIKSQLELGAAKIQFWTLQLQCIHYDRLHALLEKDLAAALAGQPAEVSLPQVYQVRRGVIREGTPWGESLKRFLTDQVEFRKAVDEVAARLPDIDGLPTPKDQLAALKALNVAQVAGMQYRLHGLFRMLDDGEIFLEAFAVPKLRPSKGKPEGKKNITDRLTGLFKGNA